VQCSNLEFLGTNLSRMADASNMDFVFRFMDPRKLRWIHLLYETCN
jgi:hypothetical protein